MSQVDGANTYYYLADGLGSTMKTIDASGNVVNAYTYDVYGEVTNSSGSQGNEFDFTGQQTDPTGLQYPRARYYDTETGSFLSRDLLEEAGGSPSGPYRYADSRPITLSDRSGLAPWDRPEFKWCAKRPHWWARCGMAAGATAFAEVVTGQMFSEETPTSDAFRHCLWSACLTIMMGTGSAETLTNLHEQLDTSGRVQEQRKDLGNNRSGRRIGIAIGIVGEYGFPAAVAGCLLALWNGDLIIDKFDAGYYPGEENILPGYDDLSGSGPVWTWPDYS